ncbi:MULTISPECIES: hypothetical protein [Bizionia]|uniref:Uncharacterized protein n=1 Tax=Bizionia algoritergicola TaxID=291187 RepID=A0A5D0QK00_9FLAO|nr:MULTISPECIES: hypothetical protein [Bizionia]OBX17738.1 hypothetical protein BAA08_15860 [Bizionia sp. APA-3]TYB69480.1 hypothetical protein ES675_16115 [Bizionia algoritergicola]
MEFKHENLTEVFKGVRLARNSDLKHPHYIFSDEIGSDYMDVHIIDNHKEFRFVIDNFPMRRRFYETNIPFRTLQDFIRALERMNVYIPHQKKAT